MRTFPGGATRDDDDAKIDYEGCLSPLALERFGQYMSKHRIQADGKLRDSDNWQRGSGIPMDQYMKSKFRHFMETWKLWRERPAIQRHKLAVEESLCAELFNTMGLLHELVKERTQSVPSWEEEEKT